MFGVSAGSARQLAARAIAARGEDVSLTPRGGEPRSVRGVFTRRLDYESVGDNDALRSRTAVLVSAADAAGVSVGDAVAVRGKSHTVRDVEGSPDVAVSLVLADAD